MSDDKWRSLAREDFEQALDEMGHVVDVSVNDLIEVTERARKHAQLRRRETVLVREVMSRPVTMVTAETRLSDAADHMLGQRISGLPVVDTGGRLIGLVTEADLLNAIGLPCHHPTQNLWQTLERLFGSRPPELHEPDETIASVMVHDVICVHPEQTLHDVLELMKSHRIKRVVVVDDNDAPIGMVTRSDLVRAFFNQQRTRLRERGSPGDDAT